MKVRLFKTTEKAYQDSLKLRDEYLRVPLGLSVYDDPIQDEDDQLHIGLFEEDQLLASVILKSLADHIVKLRQMVVDESLQGEGLGRKLIEGMEGIAREQSIIEIEMAARMTAQGFYEKLGYKTVGEPFEEVGIPHIKMIKLLN